MTLQKKHMRALVTGASAGIGEAIAAQLASHGFDLLLVARRVDRLDALAAKLSAAHGIDAQTLAADLGKPGAALAIFEEVHARGLTIDALVNNAGIGHAGKFHELPADTMSQLLQINIVALTELTRAFLPAMVERKRGHVLHVGSVAGMMPGPYMATYYASKAYVASFSDATSVELAGTGVTVTNLCPGATASEFAQVAGTADSRLFTTQPVMTSEAVAIAGVKGMLRGVRTVVPGLSNKLSAASASYAPRSLSMAISGWLNGK
jgi:uncharacterized protein